MAKQKKSAPRACHCFWTGTVAVDSTRIASSLPAFALFVYSLIIMAPSLSAPRKVNPRGQIAVFCVNLRKDIEKALGRTCVEFVPTSFRQYIVQGSMCETLGDGLIVSIRVAKDEYAHAHIRKYRSYREDSVMGHPGARVDPSPRLFGVRAGKSLSCPIAYF